MKYYLIILSLVVMYSCDQKADSTAKESNTQKTGKLKALILDGHNNHYIWPKTTRMMKSYLEETGLFEVDVHREDSIWLGIKYNPNRETPLEGYLDKYSLAEVSSAISDKPFKNSTSEINFEKYDLIVSNLGADTPEWPLPTQLAFENYMNDGGGLVVVHAANNAWGDWKAFNQMIGLGAWGNRDSITGPYAYYDDQDNLKIEPKAGQCGSHGAENEFVIKTRAPEHPIMKGLPMAWLHTQDELYDRMRGPFENATILATAYSDPEINEQPWEPSVKGSGWNVPMLMAIEYGKGRVFHTTLGHFDYSMECIGFITTFKRGTEWAAVGKVTQPIPPGFPTKEQSRSRKWSEAKEH